MADCESTSGNTVSPEVQEQLPRSEPLLIERILQGEKHLFHELIRPYERGIYAVAYAVVRNAADTEEVAQDTLLKAFRNLAQLREANHFKRWILRITLNEARLRRRRDRQHLYESLEGDDLDRSDYRPRQFADWRELPSDYIELAELRAAVCEAVQALPEKYREVYVLAENEHLSMEDMANVAGITAATAKTRLHRARLMVQDRLTPAFKGSWKDRLQLLKGMNPWFPAGR